MYIPGNPIKLIPYLRESLSSQLEDLFASLFLVHFAIKSIIRKILVAFLCILQNRIVTLSSNSNLSFYCFCSFYFYSMALGINSKHYYFLCNVYFTVLNINVGAPWKSLLSSGSEGLWQQEMRSFLCSNSTRTCVLEQCR